MNNIDILEQLVVAVEQAGTNLAPTYQEYMPLAFAVANSCGEQGRILFHRICRLSDKYLYADADKLYDHALKSGRSGNSLGTVFHLAEQAGVRIDSKLANEQKRENIQIMQNMQPSHTHTRACAKKTTSDKAPDAMPDKPMQPAPLPVFPAYSWPRFLQQVVDCGESPAQRDILLLGAVTVLGATINKLVSIVYGRKFNYPCLQTFIIAPPASGKGVLTWVRRLAEPMHEELMDKYYTQLKTYRQEKAHWDVLGKEKAKIPEPEEPHMKMFLIAGDNSGSGMMENLMDAEGVGLICETEADTVSAAIGADYGHWSHTLRNSFDHDRLSFNRRANHEYRECKKSYLSVLLSGTPAQVKPLIPSAENGLFSRELFYNMPAINEWTDQFDPLDTDYDYCFTLWGKRWKQWLDAIKVCVSDIRMKLSSEQKQQFNIHLSQVFSRADMVHGDHMKSAVARIAVNICRIMSMVALLRSLDALLSSGEEPAENLTRVLMSCPGLSPDPHVPKENVTDGIVSQWNLIITPEDFQAVLALVEPLYRHSCHVLSYLPSEEAVQQTVPREVFLDLLPLSFTRSQAIEEANRYGISTAMLNSLLKRMTDKGQLLKTGWGEYEFAARVRTHVGGCEPPA